MRIPCPFCGERDQAEFIVRADAAPVRPADPEAPGAMAVYAHLRENRAGPVREHWFHAAGCRRWLVVARDTRTHAITGAEFA